MVFKYFILSCVVAFAFNQAQSFAADDDTVTVWVVYTWKNAAQKQKYAPDPGPAHESREEAEQEGRKMVADGRAYSFVVKQERHKVTRRYKSKRPFEAPSPDYSGGYGGTIVQPSPGNLKPESPPQAPENAPKSAPKSATLRKPDFPVVDVEPYNAPPEFKRGTTIGKPDLLAVPKTKPKSKDTSLVGNVWVAEEGGKPCYYTFTEDGKVHVDMPTETNQFSPKTLDGRWVRNAGSVVISIKRYTITFREKDGRLYGRSDSEWGRSDWEAKLKE